MGLKQDIINGTKWMIITSILISISAYLFRYLMAINLSVADYGLYYSVVSLILFAITFIPFGRNEAFVRFASLCMTKRDNTGLLDLLRYYFSFKFKTAALFLIIVISCSSIIEQYYLKSSGGAFILISLAIFYALYEVFFQFILIITRVLKQLKIYSLYDLTRNIFLLVFTLICFKLGLGMLSPVIGLFLSHLLLFPVFSWYIYKRFFANNTSQKSSNTNYIPKVIKFANANVLFLASTYILNYMDTYMLTILTNFETVGLYNIAVPIAKLPTFFLSCFTVVLMPVILELYNQKKIQSMNLYVNLVFKYLLITIIPVSIFMCIHSNSILRFLFPLEYIGASSALKILAVSSIISTVFGLLTILFNSFNLPEINNKIIIFGGIINIIFNYTLINIIGLNGAAFATLISYALMVFVAFVLICTKLTVLSIDYGLFTKIIFCNILYALYLTFISKSLIPISGLTSLILTFIFSLFLYLVMIALCKLITRGDLEVVYSRN